MTIEEKRQKFLEFLKVSETEMREYFSHYSGPGLGLKIKRFIKYRNRYINYIISRKLNLRITVKAKTYKDANLELEEILDKIKEKAKKLNVNLEVKEK